MNRILLGLLVMGMLGLACSSGGGGGVSETCIKITVDSVGRGDVQSTVTNQCSAPATLELMATCYDEAGQVEDRDVEYVEDLPAGDSEYVTFVFYPYDDIARCKAEVNKVY